MKTSSVDDDEEVRIYEEDLGEAREEVGRSTSREERAMMLTAMNVHRQRRTSPARPIVFPQHAPRPDAHRDEQFWIWVTVIVA
jgi:hypothetical protein